LIQDVHIVDRSRALDRDGISAIEPKPPLPVAGSLIEA
jgi:hypothetical protein